MTHIEREIFAQPGVLDKLLRLEGKRIEKIAKSIRKANIDTLFVVARGSSDNAGQYGKYLFGARNRLVVALATPSLFTLYKRPPDLARCLVLAISQSGESDDLCSVVEEARRQGGRTLVMTNIATSPLASLGHDVIRLHAGAERSVAATKTYTAQLLALAMLSRALDGRKADRENLARVPEVIERTLDASGSVAGLAERYRYVERLSVIGRGFNYATSFELALKLKELCYLTAEPYSSADFRHGPIAIVEEGFPVLLIAPRGKTMADLKQLARSLVQRKAELLVISENRALRSLAKTILPYAAGLPEWLTPLSTVVPGQLFAMHLAAARGLPLDVPRGLSKVTRTR